MARAATRQIKDSGRTIRPVYQQVYPRWCQRLLAGLVCCWLIFGLASPAQASLQDDRFDGNIFALYAGNGSLVPPKVTLASSLASQHVSLLLFYIDDSADCKQFSSTYSQLQAGYGRAADFIPVNADTVLPGAAYGKDDPRHYYSGKVPQLVVLDQQGDVVWDQVGQTPINDIDDRLRQVFDLLPRTESEGLKRRSVNEVNVELVPQS
ncbi:MAG: thioredoxin family protein [Synechococcales cyanobacterium RM1_1_8]|nr:thioredoxin family protein [Synechococcales cyanobacterium RM1_1_8]